MVEKTKRIVVACWVCRDMIIGGILLAGCLNLSTLVYLMLP